MILFLSFIGFSNAGIRQLYASETSTEAIFQFLPVLLNQLLFLVLRAPLPSPSSSSSLQPGVPHSAENATATVEGVANEAFLALCAVVARVQPDARETAARSPELLAYVKVICADGNFFSVPFSQPARCRSLFSATTAPERSMTMALQNAGFFMTCWINSFRPRLRFSTLANIFAASVFL
jgi:hypothetical protein